MLIPSTDRAKNGASKRGGVALVSFLARPKPRISFLGLSLLRNSTETLATQANREKLIKERVEGGLFDLAKRITGSKNTVVRDRVDRLRVVQVTVNSI